ncbi:MAG: glycosyltransferase family 2 protein [Flavobacterium sp.]|nr:glycosyltransferase family 2 protein [Flavobacterium sp.]
MDTITEVLNQTFTDFELIIADDGSTDKTKSVFDSIVDPRIIYVYQSNSGVSSARNFGSTYAKSNYLIFLDSDDKVSTSWLQDYYDILSNNNKVNLVFSNMEKRKQDGQCFKIVDARNPYGNNVDFGIFIPGSFCLSKELFNCLNGYDIALKYGENTELSFRLYELNPTVDYTDKIGLFYYPSSDGGSKNLKNLVDSNLYILKKHEAYFLKHKAAKRLYLQNTAVACLKLERYKVAQKLFLQILFLYPLHIKNLFRLICSFHPKLTKLVWR